MSKKISEDTIQEEIQRRVFEEEQRKLEREGAEASNAALSEVTSLSQEEIARISKDVRAEMAEQEAKMVEQQATRKKILIGTLAAIAVLVVIGSFTVMGQYNTMIELEEQVQTKWGQVENVYQRRYDLVPNLVETVKAYAEHEQELVQMITEARAKAGGTLNVSEQILSNEDAFREFQQAQGALSNVLGRLMAVAEDNPNIKADQNFLALQAQLEGSENRISVERKRFNEAVQEYNGYIKKFPQTIFAGLFGFEKKVYFQAQDNAMNAPVVNMKK